MRANLLTLISLLGFHSAVASQCTSWNTPKLEGFQDDTPCFPLEGTWYMVYRNYESDPVFGGTAKCVSCTENGPLDGNVAPVYMGFDNGGFNGTLTLKSAPGYDVKDVLGVHVNGEDGTSDFKQVYAQCGKCSLFQNTYISDASYALWVQEDYIKDHSCCDFLYHLVAGSSPTYNIYDDTCN